MDKITALENIYDTWNDSELSLADKINGVSSAYYSAGLDLATTAAFIKATPAELETLLGLSELDDEIIELISEVNPPNTTWMMIMEASDEEIRQALESLKSNRDHSYGKDTNYTASEFVYQKMLEASGPTIEQKVGSLSGDDLKHAFKKGSDFDALNDWQKKFIKSVAAQRKMGKTLTDKQINSLRGTLTGLAEKGAITRNSIDGDQDICDRILDALEIYQ
ncbi:MAG TPA: hypothetical protein GX717_05920 [Clostridiaceae bacterium]|nr:hypothetical protein [Clostridiaceae bacterium]